MKLKGTILAAACALLAVLGAAAQTASAGLAPVSPADSADSATEALLPTDTVAATPPAEAAQPAADRTRDLMAGCTLAALVLGLAGTMMAMAARRRVREMQAAINTCAGRINELGNAITDLNANLERLNAEVEALRSQPRQPVAVAVASQRPARKPSRTAAASVQAAEPQVLYLSCPDADGYFGRATASAVAGNSVFVLRTADGRTGTFEVINDAAVHSMALMMPTATLTVACTGSGIQVSDHARRIVTDRPGKAVLRDGKWHVESQAVIHYES